MDDEVFRQDTGDGRMRRRCNCRVGGTNCTNRRRLAAEFASRRPGPLSPSRQVGGRIACRIVFLDAVDRRSGRLPGSQRAQQASRTEPRSALRPAIAAWITPYARARNAPLRVSTRIFSPCFRYSGTCTMTPGFERRRLGARRGRVAFDGRIALGDREIDRRRQLNADALVVVNQARACPADPP